GGSRCCPNTPSAHRDAFASLAPLYRRNGPGDPFYKQPPDTLDPPRNLHSTGFLRKLRAARMAANTVRAELKKNGAPGRRAGARSLMKYPKTPVASGGPMAPATLCRLVRDPWIPPCSLSATVREIMPWMAGTAMPEREPKTMMT